MPLAIAMSDTQSPTHITIDEAVEYSGYSDQYIRRLSRDGKIRGFKIAHIWMIEVISFIAYLSEVEESQSDDARFGPRRPAQRRLDQPSENGGTRSS